MADETWLGTSRAFAVRGIAERILAISVGGMRVDHYATGQCDEPGGGGGKIRVGDGWISNSRRTRFARLAADRERGWMFFLSRYPVTDVVLQIVESPGN